MLNVGAKPARIDLQAWQNLGVVGEGGFGTVCLYRSEGNGQQIAVKRMKKRQIMESKQVDHIKNEIYILNSIRNPFIVKMHGITQTPKFIMIGMEYISGGEFFNYLRQVGRLNAAQTAQYAAQVVLMLEYLHNNRIAYRDLKPENLIIDEQGYLKMTDFGFAKVVEGRTYTFCGTTEYLAPEIVLNKGHACPADWWALGVLIYEMIAGVDPYNAPDPMAVMDNIVKNKYSIPAHIPSAAKSLIERLLEPDLDRRFGNLVNGAADIRNHQFFDAIRWDQIQSKSFVPSYRPPQHSSPKLSVYDPKSELSVPGLAPTSDPFLDW